MNPPGQIITRTQTRASALLLEVVGLGLLFFFPIGTVLGLILLFLGGGLAVGHECSICHNPVASRRVTICGACHASLTPGPRKRSFLGWVIIVLTLLVILFVAVPLLAAALLSR